MTADLVPIWLDCDTGHDDAFAILLAATHERSELLGISTVFGNANVQHTTYNTRSILKVIGYEKVPVYAGAAQPYCRTATHAADIHGENGLELPEGTVLPQPTVPARTDKTAVQAMYDALSATPPGTAWLVATGALTNVALLFAVYPSLAKHVAGVSIMGGAIGDGFAPDRPGQEQIPGARIGNWTHWAEFNIYIDPESAKAVFSDPDLQGKLILAPLDLTHQFIATQDVQTILLGARRDPTKQHGGTDVRWIFVKILTFFAKTYSEVFGLRDGPPLHDPLAVAVVLEPALFGVGELEQFRIDVVTEGAHGDSAEVRAGDSQCGRTVATPIDKGVRIPRTLNQQAVWAMIDVALTRRIW